MTTIDAPHYTQCQRCDWVFVPGNWPYGPGPIVALFDHYAWWHPCTCVTRSVEQKFGRKGRREKYTLTLFCEQHVRCHECGSVLVNRRCPRCDQ